MAIAQNTGTMFSAPETYLLRLEDLGDANAKPIELAEYMRLRAANTPGKR